MKSVPPNELEVGSVALRRLQLVQVARGQDAAPWRNRLRESVRALLAIAGALLLWEHGLSSPFLLAIGVLFVAVGVTTSQNRSEARLDALIDFLDSTQQLDPNRVAHSTGDTV